MRALGARSLLVACAAMFDLAVLYAALPAGAQEGSPIHEDEIPSLFGLRNDSCREDYAAELNANGLVTKSRLFDSLETIARFVEIPVGTQVSHILLVNGFVVANHVSPDAVLKLLADKPEIRGLVGAAACATEVDHAELDARPASPF